MNEININEINRNKRKRFSAVSGFVRGRANVNFQNADFQYQRGRASASVLSAKQKYKDILFFFKDSLFFFSKKTLGFLVGFLIGSFTRILSFTRIALPRGRQCAA